MALVESRNDHRHALRRLLPAGLAHSSGVLTGARCCVAGSSRRRHRGPQHDQLELDSHSLPRPSADVTHLIRAVWKVPIPDSAGNASAAHPRLASPSPGCPGTPAAGAVPTRWSRAGRRWSVGNWEAECSLDRRSQGWLKRRSRDWRPRRLHAGVVPRPAWHRSRHDRARDFNANRCWANGRTSGAGLLFHCGRRYAPRLKPEVLRGEDRWRVVCQSHACAARGQQHH